MREAPAEMHVLYPGARDSDATLRRRRIDGRFRSTRSRGMHFTVVDEVQAGTPSASGTGLSRLHAAQASASAATTRIAGTKSERLCV